MYVTNGGLCKLGRRGAGEWQCNHCSSRHDNKTRKKSTKPIPRIWQQEKDKTELSCNESLQCMPIGTSREKNTNNKNYHEGQEARQ